MKDNLVTVSNTFIQASYELSLVEKRLLLAFISQVDNDICKEEGKERDSLEVITSDTLYNLNVKAYSELYDINYETAKEELSEAVDKLFQKEVTYRPEEGTEVTTRWISSKVTYTKGEHIIGLKWASDIIPLISELRCNFTSYKLRFLRTLGSVHSIRLYEIFIMELNKSHKSSIELTLNVQELREILKLEHKYPLFADFMKRVILDPIQAINSDTNTNIAVSVEDANGNKLYVKKGKKVVAITFKISRKYQAAETKSLQDKQIEKYGKVLDVV